MGEYIAIAMVTMSIAIGVALLFYYLHSIEQIAMQNNSILTHLICLHCEETDCDEIECVHIGYCPKYEEEL